MKSVGSARSLLRGYLYVNPYLRPVMWQAVRSATRFLQRHAQRRGR